MLATVPNHQIADLLASFVNSSYREKLDILETVDIGDRFKKALPLVKSQAEDLKTVQSQRKQNNNNNGKKRTPARLFFKCDL